MLRFRQFAPSAVFALFAPLAAAQVDCDQPSNVDIAVRCRSVRQSLSMVSGVSKDQWVKVWFVANGPSLPLTTILPNHQTLNPVTGEVRPVITAWRGIASKQDETKSRKIIAYWEAYRQQVFEINQSGRLAFGHYACDFDCSGHKAGYDWAAEKEITRESDCDSVADEDRISFEQGCKIFVELNKHNDDVEQ